MPPPQKRLLIPASTTIPRAFLSSLRANLQISFEDLNAASHLDPLQSASSSYGLPYSHDLTFSSGFADDLEDPPSPADTSTTSTTQSYAPSATWTYHASTDDDRRAALALVAESIREQRLDAIRSIVLHPAVLAVALLCFLFLVRCASHAPQIRGPVAFVMGSISLIAAFVIVERATRTYLTMASAVGDLAWLREGPYHNNKHHHHHHNRNRNHHGSAGGSSKHSHHNSMPLEDEILITKDHHGDVVAALVLRTARTNALTSGAPSANGMRALRHRHSNSNSTSSSSSSSSFSSSSSSSPSSSGRLTGVIRAWTVAKPYRQQGLGRELLESAVSICRVRRLDGPIFADHDHERLCSAHASGLRTLWWPFNGGFALVEERAKEGLKAVIEGKERRK